MPSKPLPHLVSLASAVPRFDLEQDDVANRAGEIFAPMVSDFQRLMPVYRNAEIERRHSCVPIDWYADSHSFAERNGLFLDHATALLAEAARKALDQAGLKPSDIDTLITVCSSGIATPSLDARVMQHLGFRSDVQRLPIFGLGCAGGVLGLTRAAALARAEPASRVLLLAVELCGLTFRQQDRSKSNIIATALFGDGAAAAIISCRPEHSAGPALGAAAEHTWPNSLGVMGWDVLDDGLKVVFSGNIPDLVRNDLRPVVDTFLSRQGLTLDDIAGYVCHPGGAKVLDALEACFELPPRAMREARDVLRRHGNMSSVTVLFVLQETLNSGASGRHLLTALGPGFTAAMLLMDLP
ncbi:3-oxoacyl-[acyl-carrier-protein] synthase III C-terminal domain-containing protein [Ferrovibrio sp.]|uniref:type III polyketide synthase n=1 Tax=Ferrovibrio sp. TaxID=1917215 RepID=UPI00261EF8F2|nr:3-oxoacyl-[acyl-carrier-protein] synthase III C-terminal domain-containing protein [Ferrovibrio sp.]